MNVYKSEEGRRLVFESYDRLVAAWGVETEERDLGTSYGKTHVILAGDVAAPPLLLFHGVGDNSAVMWIFNAAGLAKRFRIIAIDTMGGGGKSAPDERYRAGFDTARWQGEIMDALGIERAYAAGVSYGCYMVQLLAQAHPDRVIRVVGISGAVQGEGAKWKTLVRMLKLLLPALIPFGDPKKKIFEALTGPKRDEMIAKNPEIKVHWDLAMSNYRSASQRFHKRRDFTDEEIAAMRDRILYLIGDHDALFYGQAMESFARYGMRYEAIEGVGHTLNAEAPDLTNRFIIDFLLGG